MNEGKPLLVDERSAARLLSVSVSALRRWRREGRGPRVTRIERCVRYRLSDLDDLLAANRVPERAHQVQAAGQYGTPTQPGTHRAEAIQSGHPRYEE